MRVSAVLLVVSVLGVLGGAALIGQWAVGVVVVAMSAGLGVYAVLRDVPDRAAGLDDLRVSRERMRARARDAA